MLVAFVGGPPWVDDDGCTVDYRGEVVESDAHVEVRVLQRSPSTPNEGVTACPSVGYHRQLTLALDRPLDDRRLVAFGQTSEVFNGAELAAVRALPEGWTVRLEAWGFQPHGSNTPRERFWQRHVGPPLAENCDREPSEPGVTITEGPPELEDRRGWATDGGQHQVRSAVATYWTTESQVWLEWVEGGRGYSLSSSPACSGQATAPLDRLLALARGMAPPPAKP